MSGTNNGGRSSGIDGEGNSNPLLTNIIFVGNIGLNGGVMLNSAKGNGCVVSPNLTNVVFSGNSATYNGGAMLNIGRDGGKSNPILTNVTISGNKAGGDGGIEVEGRTGH